VTFGAIRRVTGASGREVARCSAVAFRGFPLPLRSPLCLTDSGVAPTGPFW